MNDKNWKLRSDEWVKEMHESRQRKERKASGQGTYIKLKPVVSDIEKNIKKNTV